VGRGAQDQGLDGAQSQDVADDLRRRTRDSGVEGPVEGSQSPQGCQDQDPGEGPVPGLKAGEAGRGGIVLKPGALGQGCSQEVKRGAAGGQSGGKAGFGHAEPPARFRRPWQLAFRVPDA
jgi:hypothetical protein